MQYYIFINRELLFKRQAKAVDELHALKVKMQLLKIGKFLSKEYFECFFYCLFLCNIE